MIVAIIVISVLPGRVRVRPGASAIATARSLEPGDQAATALEIDGGRSGRVNQLTF